MKISIVIPARYGSTRLPGKPLMKIGGETMLSRVVHVAQEGIHSLHDVSILVATDHAEIGAHCDKIGVPWVMTSKDCPTGTDRVLAAIQQLSSQPDFIFNLQGDAPFTPPHFIKKLAQAVLQDPIIQVITPITQLSWDDLDRLRESKKTTPFSGTCVITDQADNAVWFSKQIIPTLRNEKQLRKNSPLSPVHRHIGLYGYARKFLEKYVTWPQSHYEILEGLEQLRILENGYPIRTITLDNIPPITGIDSPEDIERAENLLRGAM